MLNNDIVLICILFHKDYKNIGAHILSLTFLIKLLNKKESSLMKKSVVLQN